MPKEDSPDYCEVVQNNLALARFLMMMAEDPQALTIPFVLETAQNLLDKELFRIFKASGMRIYELAGYAKRVGNSQYGETYLLTMAGQQAGILLRDQEKTLQAMDGIRVEISSDFTTLGASADAPWSERKRGLGRKIPKSPDGRNLDDEDPY